MLSRSYNPTSKVGSMVLGKMKETAEGFLGRPVGKESDLDVSKDPLAMQRLREAAEKAKREPHGLSATEASLPFITADATGPKHLNVRMTKAKFENLVGVQSPSMVLTK
eukprot:gene17260-19678_t